jgi:hypothetical protein
MVIHKLTITCDCGHPECVGPKGETFSISLSATSDADMEVIREIYERLEPGADRVKEATIGPESIDTMRDALDNYYNIPDVADRVLEGLRIAMGELKGGLPPIGPTKEEEDFFRELKEIELNEVG